MTPNMKKLILPPGTDIPMTPPPPPVTWAKGESSTPVVFIAGLFVALMVLVCCSAASAGDFVTRADGQRYERSRVWNARSCCWEYAYKLAPVYHPPAPVIVHAPPVVIEKIVEVPGPADPGWRSKILHIAAERERSVAAARAQAIEAREYLEALKALGLDGGGSNYGKYGALDYSESKTLLPGSTVYGYGESLELDSATSYSDVYGKTDLNVLYDNLFRSLDRAQELTGRAHDGTIETVHEAASGQQRLAEAVLKLRGAQELMREAFREPERSTIERTERRLTTGGSAVTTGGRGSITHGFEDLIPPLPDAPPAADTHTAASVIEAKCVRCHSGDDPKGGFLLAAEALGDFRAEDLDRIVARVLSTNADQRMPPAPDSLTPTEMRAILSLAP